MQLQKWQQCSHLTYFHYVSYSSSSIWLSSQCIERTSLNIQSVKCWYATGVMMNDATVVCVTNVSAVIEWVSAFSRFGPFILVTWNTVNTMNLVWVVQNVTVVWAFYVLFFSCDRDLELGKFVRRFCSQRLCAGSRFWGEQFRHVLQSRIHLPYISNCLR